MQFFNLFIPLLTLPFLTHVLGIEKFGLIAFATAIIGYFTLLCDYGLSLKGTQDISCHRDNFIKISHIVSTIITLKIFLLFLSLVILLTLSLFITTDYQLYGLLFSGLIAQTLFPQWLFQGLEKLSLLVISQLIPKIIFTILLFYTIETPNDYLLVVKLNTLSLLVTLGLGYGFSRRNFTYIAPTLRELQKYMYESWSYFTMSLSLYLYTLSIPVVLGLVSSHQMVGYYTVCDKVVRGIQSLYNPIFQTYFPKITYAFSQSLQEGLKLFHQSLTIGLIIGLLSSLSIYILAPFLVELLLAQEHLICYEFIRYLSLLGLTLTLNNLFGMQGMIALKQNHTLFKIYATITLIALGCEFVFIPLFGIQGAIAIILCSELVMLYLTIKAFYHYIFSITPTSLS